MARAALRLPQNAPGEFFVDESCIDCATCRNVAPSVFAYSDDARMSVVTRQPRTKAEALRAGMALVACPTSSIGSLEKNGLREAASAFPERVTDGVYYCGYASESSFGASSWLIVRPEGNVLVDSPRAARPLMRRIEELGGVSKMFLSHRDDVADHEQFARHFGCERILHATDVNRDTRAVERKIEGTAPVPLAPDLLVIPVPGHTRGSSALLYKNEILFTGDHLWRSEKTHRLHASHSVCWYSWTEQTRSMERLLAFGFRWVLPGHGASHQAESAEEMRAALAHLVVEMKRRT